MGKTPVVGKDTAANTSLTVGVAAVLVVLVVLATEPAVVVVDEEGALSSSVVGVGMAKAELDVVD